ncbi:MAG: peptidylprolyl isomerase [Hyphomicrobiaceae bacterium]
MTSSRRLLAAVGAAVLLVSASFAAVAEEKIVARVNGKVITEADMRLAEAEVGNELAQLPPNMRRRVLVEFLIENQLFADAADKEKLSEQAAFAERMKYSRRRALRDAYFEKVVQKAVTEAEAKALYDKQIGSVKAPEEVRVRHILVKTEAEAKDVIERLRRGDAFDAVAKEKSLDPGSKARGGDLGYFAKGQMVKEFEETAFKLKKDEISAPVKTQFGFHVLKLEDRRTRPLPTFEMLKDRIMGSLIHRKAQEVIAKLREGSKVELVDAELKKVEEAEKAAAKKKAEEAKKKAAEPKKAPEKK